MKKKPTLAERLGFLKNLPNGVQKSIKISKEDQADAFKILYFNGFKWESVAKTTCTFLVSKK